MQLKELTNYKNGFSFIKTVSIAAIAVMGTVTCISVYFAYSTLEKVSNTVYVMGPDGKITAATRTDADDPKARKIEYQAHVRNFYKLWYQFDESNFKTNINDALYLAGNCAKEMKISYDNDDLNTKLQKFNMRCEVTIDSININMQTVPVSGSIYGTQSILRPSGSIKRRMDCTYELYDFDRSANNPHGVKIENWKQVNTAEINPEGENINTDEGNGSFFPSVNK